MAFTVLFSTFSFSVALHYCGDTLVATALFKNAETCGMEALETTDTPGCNLLKKNCCTDENIHVAGQNEINIPVYNPVSGPHFFPAPPGIVYQELFRGLKENTIPHNGHAPPLIVRDIHLLNQIFLI